MYYDMKKKLGRPPLTSEQKQPPKERFAVFMTVEFADKVRKHGGAEFIRKLLTDHFEDEKKSS
jgi:hypothetical protein